MLGASPLSGASGDPQGAVLSIKSSEILSLVGQEERAAVRAEEMQMLAYGIAHEIKNPLGGILGAAQWILRGEGPDEDRAEGVRLILREARRINDLVEKMLEMGKTPPPPRPFALLPLLREAEQLLLSEARAQGKEIRFDLRVDPSLPPISGHPDTVYRALLNILKNAVEAIERAGTVGIEARMNVNYRFARGRGRKRSFLEVEITDNGKGMTGRGAAQGAPPLLHHEGARHGARPGDGPAGGDAARGEDGDPLFSRRRNRGNTIPSGRSGEKGRDVKRILIADDDESIRWVLRKTVTGMGFAADLAEDGEQALALLGKNTYAAAFVDIRMPGVEGIEVLERVQARKSPTRFFIMTAVRRPDVAARSTRAGAAEFITKPFDLSRIEELLRNVASEASSRERPYHPGAQDDWSSERIVGKSRVLLELFQNVGKVAGSDASVLLLGQRGVGKELIARSIHDLGGRTGPFVAVNIPAIPRDLQEAELFGHEKGAFTGAESARPGKLAAATDGTLFLDEIGDTPLDLQAKLLRVLQEREYAPVGSNQPRTFRGGIIAATNRDLRKMVADGRFREDLFDRLNVFPLRVPSLAERKEDIPLLADHFLQKYCAVLSRPPRSFSKEAVEELSARPWKGNVRELENFVQRLAVLSPGKLLRRDDVVRELARAEGAPETSSAPMEQLVEERIREFLRRLGPALDSETRLHELFVRQVERPLVKVVLEATAGNQIRAAAILGIHRNTLRKKIAELGLAPKARKRKGA